MAPRSDLSQSARPPGCQSPLLSPFGFAQLERDTGLKETLNFTSGLTCLEAPDMHALWGREKAATGVKGLEWVSPLGARLHPPNGGAWVKCSDSSRMLQSPLAAQLVMTWSWAE